MVTVLIDAGHEEQLPHEKKLNVFTTNLMSVAQVENHKTSFTAENLKDQKSFSLVLTGI
jgi:hypothetical protein